MATFEEKPLVEPEEDLYDHDQEGSSCACFRVFRFRRWQQEEDREGWATNKLRKMKEASEVVAGPKWKRLMNCRKQKNRFQYDEHSYALNFDSGAMSEAEDLDLPPSFSTRFSVPRRQTES